MILQVDHPGDIISNQETFRHRIVILVRDEIQVSVWRGKLFLLGWCIRENMVGLVAVSPQEKPSTSHLLSLWWILLQVRYKWFQLQVLGHVFLRQQTPYLKEVEERESSHQVRNLTKMETPPVDVAPMVPRAWLLNGGISNHGCYGLLEENHL